MGESKRKKHHLPAEFKTVVFARAVRKLFTATSMSLGTDCYTHAAIARAALSRLGIESTLCTGYAAWRVDGQASHAVVSHHPSGQLIHAPSDNAMLYHAWLQIGYDLVDFTTYQLRGKALEMDSADGNVTPVTWCPDYLWASVKSGTSYANVRDGYAAGLYCYQRDPIIEAKARWHAMPIEPEDIDILLTLYRAELQGPVRVIGPNDLRTAAADRHGRLKAEAVSPRKPRGETVYPTCVSARGDTKRASERGVESSRELATESQRAKRRCDVVPVTGTAGAQ